MNKEKKIWQFEQYAQKMWIISINMTTEAARIGGNVGAGLAVVAEECRNLSQKISAYVGESRFESGKDDDFKGITDAAFQMNLLAVNAGLENFRVRKLAEKSDYRSISVCIEEIRELACGISELALEKKYNHTPIPEIVSPLKSTEMDDYFLQYSIGGVPFIENTNYIGEINYPPKSSFEGDIFNLRGLEVPIIDLYKRLNLKTNESERQEVMLILYDNKKYIVPIDGVYGIIISKIGYNVPPKAGHPFTGYVRECWDAVGGDQLLFIDWEKFI